MDIVSLIVLYGQKKKKAKQREKEKKDTDILTYLLEINTVSCIMSRIQNKENCLWFQYRAKSGLGPRNHS